ncbi:MAG: hypothetical protein C0448_15640 [Sphingobacteriaceae bacterium]|nr:hypothetical protein [Sphingobacteriaceae bacterium]
MDKNIKIELTKDEAIVLFDFLSRFNAIENNNVFEDQAEQQTLWSIEGQLEKTLTEPLTPNYSDIVKQARDKIRNIEQ